jgi:hypothetical protein
VHRGDGVSMESFGGGGLEVGGGLATVVRTRSMVEEGLDFPGRISRRDQYGYTHSSQSRAGKVEEKVVPR